MDDLWLVQNSTFHLVVQSFLLIILVATVLGMAFVASEIVRPGRHESGDRNWRFLFACWADSVLIMALYGVSNLVWLIRDGMDFLRFAGGSVYAEMRNTQVHFVTWTVELVLYSMILIVAIRLAFKIRRFLEQS